MYGGKFSQAGAFYPKVTRQEKLQLETGVSRHHGGPIQGPWNPSDHHSIYGIRGSKGELNWSPLMPRNASLSDSWCGFSRLARWLLTQSQRTPPLESTTPTVKTSCFFKRFFQNRKRFFFIFNIFQQISFCSAFSWPQRFRTPTFF